MSTSHTESIATPWSLTRQRRYDELFAEVFGRPATGLTYEARQSMAVWNAHKEVMRRLDAECEALTDDQQTLEK